MKQRRSNCNRSLRIFEQCCPNIPAWSRQLTAHALFEFGDFSLDIEVFAYVLAPDWLGFLAVQEDLLIRLMGIIEANGTSFAFPSQTMYITKDPGSAELKAFNDASPRKADG